VSWNRASTFTSLAAQMETLAQLKPSFSSTDKTIPQWQLDVHTYSDACKAKLLLVADARRECEVYLRRKEMEEGVARYSEERPSWGY
jgi:hypothetical protein